MTPPRIYEKQDIFIKFQQGKLALKVIYLQDLQVAAGSIYSQNISHCFTTFPNTCFVFVFSSSPFRQAKILKNYAKAFQPLRITAVFLPRFQFVVYHRVSGKSLFYDRACCQNSPGVFKPVSPL